MVQVQNIILIQQEKATYKNKHQLEIKVKKQVIVLNLHHIGLIAIIK